MRLFICSIALLLFFSCKREGASSSRTNTSPTATTSTDGFDEFYQKFHADSLYQIEHIVFPLDGLPNNFQDSTLNLGKFQWQKEDWIMHKAFDPNDESFIREIDHMSNTLVVEFIRMSTGEYGMERRFAKLSNKWFLIHYTAMNKLVPSE